jgi:hypothetical protein
MKKLNKVATIAVTALLLQLTTMAPATARVDALQSSPDTFDQATGKYASIWANSMVELPVIDNDASKNSPDVRVCRMDVAPGQTYEFLSASLRDGDVILSVDRHYKHDWVKLIYQLCDKQVVGPETLVQVGVRPLKLVRAKNVKGGRIKLTNPNNAPVQCHLSDAGPSSDTYFHKKLAPYSSVTTKARYPRSHFACSIGSHGTDAGNGEL